MADYYEEKSKLLERESKKKAKKPCASDEEKDEDVREVAFAEFVDECQEKVNIQFYIFSALSRILQVFENFPHTISCQKVGFYCLNFLV